MSAEKEVFVIRRGKQEELEEYLQKYCRPLYRSDVHFDREGNIFYPSWRQVKREKVGPEDFALLSKKRVREEVYLGWSLTTKTLYERRINQVTKDNGSVEAAIRSMEHVLRQETGKETTQVKTVRERVRELLDLFGSRELSQIPPEELKAAQQETVGKLFQVGLDPEMVILEEKERMIRWLVKGSGGKDILGRPNELITYGAILAANRRAIERQTGINNIIPKYLRMREALLIERAFCRGIFEEVADWLKPQGLPSEYHLKYPQATRDKKTRVGGIINHLAWQLDQPHVKPYRPAGRLVNQILNQTTELLGQDRRQEIVDLNLFGQAREILAVTLEQFKDIYPQES